MRIAKVLQNKGTALSSLEAGSQNLVRAVGASLVALLLSITFVTPAGAVQDETAAGFETILRDTNDYREANGVDRLVHDPRISAVAQAWAERMASDYAASGDTSTAFRHNPDMSDQIPSGWQGAGENIAVNAGYPTPYKQLMIQWRNSPPHNESMLNPGWTHIGVGVYQDSLGYTWGVQVFGDYGTPSAIPDPVDVVIDLDNVSYSGTADCVVLVSEPSGNDFFKQCGARPGNVFTFSDVPPGSYSIRLLTSNGTEICFGSSSTGGVFTASSAGMSSQPTCSGVHAALTRLAGASRYDTGVAISKASFSAPIDTVFIATGENFPDALSVGPAAASLGSPVILVQHNSVPASVVTEIKRLSPRKIVVLGGPSVINDTVFNQLKTLAGTGGAARVYGANRYSTAAKVATQYFPSNTTDTAFLATGTNYPDALSGGPVGGINGYPLLLSTKTSVPAETLAAMKTLGITKVVFLGGEGVLSSTLKTQITGALGPVTISRYSGSSRYDTSAAIVSNYFTPATTNVAYITVGDNFPDALAGAASAAAANAPILLSQKTCMPAATYLALKNLNVNRIILLGGTGVINSDAASKQC